MTLLELNVIRSDERGVTLLAGRYTLYYSYRTFIGVWDIVKDTLHVLKKSSAPSVTTSRHIASLLKEHESDTTIIEYSEAALTVLCSNIVL